MKACRISPMAVLLVAFVGGPLALIQAASLWASLWAVLAAVLR